MARLLRQTTENRKMVRENDEECWRFDVYTFKFRSLISFAFTLFFARRHYLTTAAPAFPRAYGIDDK